MLNRLKETAGVDLERSGRVEVPHYNYLTGNTFKFITTCRQIKTAEKGNVSGK